MPSDTRFECHVLPGADFSVTAGANLGDQMGPAEELCPGDTYRLTATAPAARLTILDGGGGDGRVLGTSLGPHSVAGGSEIGCQGDPVSVSARLRLMAPEGHAVDLLLIELGADTCAVLPLDPLDPGRDHILVSVDPPPDTIRLADITSVAFARGTRITLADGRQHAVESLAAGMKVLTRDHGAQALRWVVHRTVRGVGPYAPVVIPQNTLGNAADLALSQHQRLFIYQRGSDRLTETAEMLVRAHYLVDDEQIFVRSGGFVDYYTLVFDRHEVIYAEGIPVESLQVSTSTLPHLAEDVVAEVDTAVPGLDHAPHAGTDADASTGAAARAKLLRGDT